MKVRRIFLALIWAASLMGLTGALLGRSGEPSSGMARAAALAPQPVAVIRLGDGAPADYPLALGEQFTTTVEAVDLTNLGTAVLELAYDPTVVQLVQCQTAAVPHLDGGDCNPAFAPGVARLSLIATGGVSGSLPLFQLVFKAVGVSPQPSSLGLSALSFADPLGAPLQVMVQGGSVTVATGSGAVEVVARVGDGRGYTVTAGDSVTIAASLAVTGLQSVGAAVFLLAYDPQVLQPVTCSQSGDAPLAGGCNLAFDPAAGLIKFNVIAPQGVTGLLPLVQVRFLAAPGAEPGSVSPLTLIPQAISSPLGLPLSWQTFGDQVTVLAGTAPVAQILVGSPQESGVYTVTQGATLAVPLWISGVVGLGAVSLAVQFDPRVVQALPCQIHTDLPTGDGATCTVEADRVRANLIATRGISGSFAFLDLRFAPAAGLWMTQTSPLTLTVQALADTAGGPMPARLRHGRLTATPGDGVHLAWLRVKDESGASQLSMALDGEISVTVGLENVANLGALSLNLYYDPAVLQLLGCQPSAPFDGALCNPAFGPGMARLNLVSLTGFTGTTPAGYFHFTSAQAAQPGDESGISLIPTQVQDITGAPLAYRTVPGAIQLTSPSQEISHILLSPGAQPYAVAAGQRITVPVHAQFDQAQFPVKLGAATLSLHFDPTVAQPAECGINADAQANGLEGGGLGGGSFEGGGCNLYFEPGEIRFSLLSTQGVTTSTDLARVVLVGIGLPGQKSGLSLSVHQLTDPQAAPLRYAATTNSLRILGAAALMATRQLTVTEGGAAGQYTVVLAGPPTHPVTVTVQPNPQLQTDPQQLLFTPTNWDLAQTITVTALDDAIEEAPFTGPISHTVTSLDPAYQGLPAQSVTVLVLDNDAVTPTATSTPSPTSTPGGPTLTPTSTPSPTTTPDGPTLTPTATPTGGPTLTSTATSSPTITPGGPTLTPTATSSPTITPGGPTLTPTATPSPTITPDGPTLTPTATPSPTITPGGPTLTPTTTPSPTITPDGPTLTPTATATPTITPGGPTLTPTATPSPDGPTLTPTATPSPTITPDGPTLTPTATATPTITPDGPTLTPTATATPTSTPGGPTLTPTATPSPTVTPGGPTLTPTATPAEYAQFLAILHKPLPASHLPDLVVRSIFADGITLGIVIENQGDRAVEQDFWVDLYIDPWVVPSSVNQIWPAVALQGLVWGVIAPAVPLAPGERLTLTVGDAYYVSEESHITEALLAGTSLYVQVDSANAETTYGAVRESHELTGDPYNNIFGPFTLPEVWTPWTIPVRETGQWFKSSTLPERSRP